MRTTQIEYPSADGASVVAAIMWRPDSDDRVRGIVQLVHGMAEHKSRYAPFAEFLTNRGFMVCAHDHVGHGKTAARPEDFGHIPMYAVEAAPRTSAEEADRNADASGAARSSRSEAARLSGGSRRHAARRGRLKGSDILVADVHELRLRMQANYPNVPYVMFGHSMGSYVVRVYVSHYGDGLAAAILCGTGQTPSWLSRVGIAATHALGALRGERYRSPFIDSLGVGAYSKKVPNAKTNYDWISSEREAVDEYASDPSCGFMFTVGGYAALTGVTLEAASSKSAARIPKDLPMLFVSGAEDPVGAKGKGVDAAVVEYRAAGVRTVDEKLYPGMRHEIVNRPDGCVVREDIDAWLAKQGI